MLQLCNTIKIEKNKHIYVVIIFMANINTINHIIDNLYASSKEIASNEEILKQYNIRIIVSLNGQHFNYPNIISYTFNTEDNPNYDMSNHYDEIFSIINNNHNILVHCDAGVSRTGSIIIYYLMHKYKMSYDIAFEYATSKRPCISPNNGFELGLRLFELNHPDNHTDNQRINFIYYNELVSFLNNNKVNCIIGVGNGMKYGNYFYNIDNNIDDLLENYDNIKKNMNNSVVIYGTKYLIDIIKNIYYKTNNNLTNEEFDKISSNYKCQKFNIFDINVEDLVNYKKSDIHQLITKLDGYSCKSIDERNHKKNLMIKIETLI
jgi:protein-tyrosine phosphatase